MNKKSLVALASTIAISATAVFSPLSIKNQANAVSKDSTIKIMSIGDSITDGYGTDGSYRKFMYNSLTNAGYSIDMVGPNWSWGDTTYTDEVTGETFTYDPAHCGYSGYSIVDYSGRNGIYETIKNGDYLATYSPDIVILQIGTNDVIDNHEIDSSEERLETLVDYILDNISSDSTLFVTTIPNLSPNVSDVYSWFGNYRHSSDWQTSYTDEEVIVSVQASVDSYNAKVKDLVQSKQASGVSNIYLGNINSVITDVSTQLKDGVHPNNTGYKLMGEYWSSVLDSFLSNGSVTEPTTESVTTTEATTVVTTPVVETTTTTTTTVTEATEPETTTTTVTTTTATTESTTVTTVIVTEPTEVVTTTVDVTDPDTTNQTTTEKETEVITETTTEITTEATTEVTENTENTDALYRQGDVNNDTITNIADVVYLNRYLLKTVSLTTKQSENADVNMDGKVNIIDLVLLKDLVSGL